MQPDFFEDPFDSQLKHLSKKREQILDQLDGINSELRAHLRATKRYGIDARGALYLVQSATGGVYLYDSRIEETRYAITPISVYHLKTAINTIESRSDEIK